MCASMNQYLPYFNSSALAPLVYRYFDSPLGALLLVGSRNEQVRALTGYADAEVLCRIAFPESRKHVIDDSWQLQPQSMPAVCQQLTAYFAGEQRHFDMPLAAVGTRFQHCVWRELLAIEFGTTRSYGQIANAIENPNAVRAVGSANGRNPIPIVIPCHRVIGSDGSLTGFGGGLPTKQFLLQLEHPQQASLPV